MSLPRTDAVDSQTRTQAVFVPVDNAPPVSKAGRRTSVVVSRSLGSLSTTPTSPDTPIKAAGKAEGKTPEKVSKQAQIIGRSSDARQEHIALKQTVQSGTGVMTVPAKLFVAPHELKASKSIKKDHETMAKAAVAKGEYLNVPSITVDGVGEMRACSFVERWRAKGMSEGKPAEKVREFLMKQGEVTPTSFIEGGVNESQARHLMNTYTIMVEGKEYAVIRTGVIDSEQRVDEFITLLTQIHEDIKKQTGNPNFKMRVVSHQLNSFDIKKEAKMIQSQHKLMAYANGVLKKNGVGEVLHLNSPSNRWYERTLQFPNLVRFMSLFTNKLGWGPFSGEKFSKQQNIDSLGTYSKWMKEDIERPKINLSKSEKVLLEHLGIEVPEPLTADGIRTLRKQIAAGDKDVTLVEMSLMGGIERKCKSLEIHPHSVLEFQKIPSQSEKALNCQALIEQALINGSTKVLEQLRKEMEGYLKEDYEHFEKMKGLSDLPQHLLQKATLMHMILGSQLGIKPLDRGQEGLCFQLLNSLMGITSAMNCKSGLDRTGMMHAVKLSLESLLKEDPEKAFNLVTNWERIATKMNAHNAAGTLENFMKNSPNFDADRKDVALMGHMIEFRKKVLGNLIQTGLPITGISTGVLGLKWHSGTWQENLLPLNFLPSHVIVDKYFVQIGGKTVNLTPLPFKRQAGVHEVVPEEFIGFHDGKQISVERRIRADGVEEYVKIMDGEKESIELQHKQETLELVKYKPDGTIKGMSSEGKYLLPKFSGFRGS